jgi:hypothetical protein
MKLALGFILGLLLGYAVNVYANGYLMGWEVTKDGVTICDDPYMWSTLKEIECD